MKDYNKIDEEHGVLSLDDIQKTVTSVFQNYDISFCVLFGSYARGEAQEKSDVDLLVDTPVTGLRFYGLVESLREALHKKVDLLNLDSLKNNEELTKNVLREGIRIYDKNKK